MMATRRPERTNIVEINRKEKDVDMTVHHLEGHQERNYRYNVYRKIVTKINKPKYPVKHHNAKIRHVYANQPKSSTNFHATHPLWSVRLCASKFCIIYVINANNP